MASHDRGYPRRRTWTGVIARLAWLSAITVLVFTVVAALSSDSTNAQAPPGRQDDVQCSPPPTGRTAIIPDDIEQVEGARVTFESGVPADERTAVISAVVTADRYFRDTLGFVMSDVCIDVYASAPALAGRGATNGSRIALYTSSEGWPDRTAGQLALVTTHELVHVWQFGLAREYAGAEPAWLVEGSADVVALEITVREGTVDAQEAAKRTTLPTGPLVARMAAVESYEVLRGVIPQQRLAIVATKLLTDHFSALSLRDFWTRVGQGAPWQRAFADVYGLSPEAFYVLVDDYVRGGPMPVLDPTAIEASP